MPLAKVLVLDDEVQVRDCIRRQLTQSGYDTAGAGSALDAMNMLRSGFFDLVVCDLCMPGSGGIEFLRQATVHHPDTGVVLMSGVHDLQLAVEAMRLGALDYISKPFTADRIAGTVAGALGRLRERAERRLYLKRLEESLLDHGVELSQALASPAAASESTLNALAITLCILPRSWEWQTNLGKTSVKEPCCMTSGRSAFPIEFSSSRANSRQRSGSRCANIPRSVIGF